ncbi:MAG: hypothetical protein AAF414_15380 [Pseudomonadota bacterium]
MRSNLVAAVCAGVLLMAIGLPAAADGEGDERRLWVSASQCAAADGAWRDNGDISICSVEIGHFVCEVDALECEFEPASRQVYTVQQAMEFLDRISVAQQQPFRKAG